MGENIKGKELVEREPMRTGFKKWDGMHDGKESGKNKWVVKIKLKKKKTDRHGILLFFFFFLITLIF